MGRSSVFVGVALVVLLAGCAAGTSPGPLPSSSAAERVVAVDPGHRPIGTWFATGWTDRGGSLVAPPSGVRPRVDISASGASGFAISLPVDCRGTGVVLSVGPAGRLTHLPDAEAAAACTRSLSASEEYLGYVAPRLRRADRAEVRNGTLVFTASGVPSATVVLTPADCATVPAHRPSGVQDCVRPTVA